MCPASARGLATRRACKRGLAPRVPLSAAFQLEGACVQQRILERKKLEVFGSNVAGAQPVPAPLLPVVLVDLFWSRGNLSRPNIGLAPSLPLFCAFQVEGACIQQRLLERQKLVVFGSNCAGAQPGPVPMPSVMLLNLIWWKAC